MSTRRSSASRSTVSKNRKGLKVLGLSALHLVDGFLTGEKHGHLSVDEYFLFWRDLASDGSEADITEYLRLCLFALFEAMEGRRTLSYPFHSLINTISFIASSMPTIAGSARLKSTMNDSKTSRGDRGNFSAADEVIRTVQKRLVEKDPALDTLLIQMSTLYSAQELTVLSDFLHYPSLDGSKVSGGELAFVYFNLRDYILENLDRSYDLLGKLLGMFSSLPQTLKLSPILAQTKMLALLHLVQELLRRKPLSYDKFCRRALSVLKPFLVWPAEFSQQVLYTLRLLQNEVAFPGVSFISRLADESRSSLMVWTGNDEQRLLAPLFYIVDANSPQASRLFQIMAMFDYDVEEKERSFSNPGRGLSHDRMGLTLLYLFNAHLKLTNEDIEMVKYCDSALLKQAFNDAVAIAIANKKTHATEQSSVASQLCEIQQVLRSHALQGNTSREPNFSDEFCDDFVPNPPEMAHVACIDPVWYRVLTNASKLKSRHPVTPLKRRLTIMLKHLKEVSNVNDPVLFRLICSGSDRVLHSLLCAYCSLLDENAELFEGITIQWYLVPVDDNLLASFLARHDGWYNRHLYTPFRARQFLMPTLASKEVDFPARKYCKEPAVPPGAFLRQCVESYVREANNVLPLQIYKIEAWESAESAAKRIEPDQTIPLSARLEISARVEARHYQTMNKDTRKLQDIIKAVNLPLPQLRLTYSKVDMSGQINEPVRQDGLVFDGIVLANVPIAKDPCFPADPSEPWLEMYAQVHNSSASKRTRHSSEQRSRVSLVEVWAPIPFSILVDSSCFGPFYRIVVSAENLQIPISTFNPIRRF